MTRAIALCAFDLDGTLVDTAADIALHAGSALRAIAAPDVDTAAILPHVGRGARELMRGLIDARMGARADDPLVDRATAAFARAYSERPIVHARLYAGAARALAALRRARVACAVVTNKPEPIATAILGALGVAPDLVYISGAREGEPLKPAPNMLRRTSSAAGVAAERMALVGDSAIDLDTARAFGCAFFGVAHGFDAGAGLRARQCNPLPAFDDVVRAVLDQLVHAAA